MGKVKKTSRDEHSLEILRQNKKRSSSKIVTKVGKVKKKVAKKFTTFKCQFCNKQFNDKYNCMNHEKIHSSDTFPCTQCPYQGKTRKYLSRHIKLSHSEPGHKCSVCGKSFHFETKLKEHVMVHTGEKPHKCEVCGKAFRVMFSLNGHMLIHKNEKPYKCSHCDYACRDNSTLRKHENRHLGIVKTFGCKLCTKKFPERAKLKYHISEVHLDYLELDLKSHPCDKCDKAFKSKYHLTKHVQVVHDKAFTCRCPVCRRRVSSRYNLPAHLRTHFHERPYACAHADCDKTFKDKSSLKKHSIIHQPRLQHACRTCGAKFSRGYRLTNHMRVHEPRDKCIQCDYCGVSFYTKNYLIKHIKAKHCAEKKKFICDHCDLVTYNKPSIMMHLKYGHCRDHKLRCNICKTTYKRFEYLRSHYLKTHNIRYKARKKCNRKERKPSVEVKMEPIDSDENGNVFDDNMSLLEIRKEEIIETEDPSPEDEYLAYSKHVLSEDLAECVLKNTSDDGIPEGNFDKFLFKHVFNKHDPKAEEPIEDEVNEEQRTFVTRKIKEIITKAKETESAKVLRKRRKKEAKVMEKKLKREAKLMRRKRRLEIMELMRVRQMYNVRMRAVAEEGRKNEPTKTIKYYKQKTTEKTCTDKQTDQRKTIVIDENTSHIDKNVLKLQNKDPLVTDEVVKQNDDSNELIKTNETKKSNANQDISRVLNDEHDSANTVKNYGDTMTDSIIVNGGNNLLNNNKSINDIGNFLIHDKGEDDSRNDHDGNDSRNDHGRNDSRNDHGRNDKTDGKESPNDDDSDDDKSEDGSEYEPNSNEETAGNKKIKFRTHQCYICFKLYPTKEDLIAHCQTHFDICNSTTLVKCPVCAHVTNANIAKHMLNKHQIEVKVPYNRITDRKNTTEGSRYCYKMDDTIIEIIPSVKILNHNAAIEIDKKNRERRNKTIAKTRLVKKGTEWIVENVAVNISFEELPEFTELELSKLPVTGNYIDRLGQLSRLAKRRGVKMMFPCNQCDKICQNFSALKLHGRRHDPNKKPFAPKRYKRNATPAPLNNKPEVNLENRLGMPQPITHKHKCDEKLKIFYETHIRGADIEFWQFLKIFNKMDRENIQDFQDFEGRTEFGIHTNEQRRNNNPKPAEVTTLTATKEIERGTNSKIKSKLKRGGIKDTKKPYKRVIMISKKQHLEREKAKMRLRENLKHV